MKILACHVTMTSYNVLVEFIYLWGKINEQLVTTSSHDSAVSLPILCNIIGFIDLIP